MTQVPKEVLADWAERAAGNEAIRASIHEKNKWGGRHEADTVEDCWHCQRQVAVCKSKRRHETFDDALTHSAEEVSNGRLLVPYRCVWGNGLHWHLATAKGSASRRRAKKFGRRHLKTAEV